MTALRIGIIVTDGVTYGETAALREHLEAIGMRVTVLVPTGSDLLPVGGRYYPGAGGTAVRRPLHHARANDFDLMLIPDSVNVDKLLKYDDVLAFLGETSADGKDPLPVFSLKYLEWLLHRETRLDGLARPSPEKVYAAAAP